MTNPSINIINNPEEYTEYYRYPSATIKYFESLIPDEQMRNYVLSFIKTKLTTFKPSPVILCLTGVHGAGKNTFINILGRIVGHEGVARPNTNLFRCPYNDWMLNRYFVQLDEYGAILRPKGQQEAMDKLELYSSNKEIEIKTLGEKPFTCEHYTTFILTSIGAGLPLEPSRKIAMINTPNELRKEDWVVKSGGIGHNMVVIERERYDFCYYLGTEVETLSDYDYFNAPKIPEEVPEVDQPPVWYTLVQYVKTGAFQELAKLGKAHDIEEFTRGWLRDKMDQSKLVELYRAMTNDRGCSELLLEKLHEAGFSPFCLTFEGCSIYYYKLEGLRAARQHIDPEAQNERRIP